MKSIIIITLVSCSLSLTLQSQSLEELLQSAQQNNARIMALEKWLDYEEVRSRTGIYPDDPEISYIHLWGNPEAPGNQQEFEISQSFKMPGYYRSLSQAQKLQFEQKNLLAERERQEVFHEIRTLYFELVWLKKKEGLINMYKSESEQLLSLMKEGYDKGEVSKPELDKAMISDIKVQNDWSLIQSDVNIKKARLHEITGTEMNDDISLEYPVSWELPEIDTLLLKIPETNPEMLMAELDISESAMMKKFEKMDTWPTFMAGYKSESILDQRLRGVHAGLSIPLWENKNDIRKADLRIDWAETAYEERRIRIRTEVSTVWNQAATCLETVSRMEDILRSEQITGSSLSLLQSGQISFHEYLLEKEIVKEVHLDFLELQRKYYEHLSKLKSLAGY